MSDRVFLDEESPHTASTRLTFGAILLILLPMGDVTPLPSPPNGHPPAEPDPGQLVLTIHAFPDGSVKLHSPLPKLQVIRLLCNMVPMLAEQMTQEASRIVLPKPGGQFRAFVQNLKGARRS